MSGCERGIGAREVTCGTCGPFVSDEFRKKWGLSVWTLTATAFAVHETTTPHPCADLV